MPAEPPIPASMVEEWTPGPEHPRLGELALHLWRAELGAVGERLLDLLSQNEQARAARFPKEHDRRLWSHARGLLRELLGRYLESDPGALRISSGAHGKPELAGRISFNVSHSGGVALYAICNLESVGVDLELSGRRRDVVALAARAFGPVEARRLAALDPSEREHRFLRLWVRHEARLKCLGDGLGSGSPDPAPPQWMRDLDVGLGAAAAVALSQAPREVHCWDWCGG
jgi:4'-phosphopantetheinyl transferase